MPGSPGGDWVAGSLFEKERGKRDYPEVYTDGMGRYIRGYSETPGDYGNRTATRG